MTPNFKIIEMTISMGWNRAPVVTSTSRSA